MQRNGGKPELKVTALSEIRGTQGGASAYPRVALYLLAGIAVVAGLYLAPLLAIAKRICDRVDSLKPAAELLGQ